LTEERCHGRCTARFTGYSQHPPQSLLRLPDVVILDQQRSMDILRGQWVHQLADLAWSERLCRYAPGFRLYGVTCFQGTI